MLAILATGVLVGYVEEILFRGSSSARCEPAAAAKLMPRSGPRSRSACSTCPRARRDRGLQLAQVAVAAALTLYLFRRSTGTIVAAMTAHGFWDISTFLTASHGPTWISIANVIPIPFGLILGVIALVSITRTDRHAVVVPGGIDEAATD